MALPSLHREEGSWATHVQVSGWAFSQKLLGESRQLDGEKCVVFMQLFGSSLLLLQLLLLVVELLLLLALLEDFGDLADLGGLGGFADFDDLDDFARVCNKTLYPTSQWVVHEVSFQASTLIFYLIG